MIAHKHHSHIIPALGARKLRELSADDVDRWLVPHQATFARSTIERSRSS